MTAPASLQTPHSTSHAPSHNDPRLMTHDPGTAHDPQPGLQVQAVDPGSPLGEAGLRPGDVILAVEDLVPRDLIDLQFDLAGATRITIRRPHDPFAGILGGRVLKLRLPGPVGDASGIELQDPVPGGIRECNNHCEFCFIRGLPPGLRQTLYVFDDDYRYSFLWGNFLTLTNLDEADWARIGYQRLSPLNVSVHATDPDVRRRLLNNRHAPPILPQLHRLQRMGVCVNAQIVLCAGINNGPVLEKSIHELAALHPSVRSVSVVPVGLTRFSRVRHIRRPDPHEAEEAVLACERWQADLRPRLGIGFVYPSDELYLLAGRPDLPPADAYDGFPALSNGVGMLRSMLDDWERLLARRRRTPLPRKMVWLTGRLAAPALERMAESLKSFAGWRPSVYIVKNRFFGDAVSVSGLLSGADLVAALEALPRDVEDVVLPRSAFGFDGRSTLDGVPAEEVGAAHPGRVHLAASPAEILEVLYDSPTSQGRAARHGNTSTQPGD
jgi:putative radical SAM enzyme (TIGR03279 family)